MGPLPAIRRCAWGDESFKEDPEHGVYVLAAAVIEEHDRATSREILLGLRGRRHVSKLHWREMEQSEQRQAAKALADLESLHIVVIAAPVPPRRQERARVKCLQQLVPELDSYAVDTLYLEAREPKLNKADARTVAQIRQNELAKGSRFRVEHVHGADAVQLWSADIVAGICRAAHEGRPELQDILADRIYDLHIPSGE